MAQAHPIPARPGPGGATRGILGAGRAAGARVPCQLVSTAPWYALAACGRLRTAERLLEGGALGVPLHALQVVAACARHRDESRVPEPRRWASADAARPALHPANSAGGPLPLVPP